MLKQCAETDVSHFFSVRWGVDGALDLDVRGRLGRKKLHRVVFKLAVDSVRPVVLLVFHIYEALSRADCIGLRLVHEEDYVGEAADLDLIVLEASELHVVEHSDVLYFKGNLQHVLAREFLLTEKEGFRESWSTLNTYLKAPDADGLINTC